MLELDGVVYTVKTPAENTTDMLNRINNYCADNDIRNSKDELVTIAETPSNPLYIILWGLGYLVAIIQKLLYSIACGFSIQESSEKQLLNLADLAGIKRQQATKTTIDLVVYALTSGNNPCSITTEDTVTIDGHVYRPAFNLTIPVNSVGHVILVCDDEGSYSISEDVMTDFDTPLQYMRAFKQYASTPGHEEESITSLRERMQRRIYSGTSLDATQDAILALDGVTTCSIYFNPSVDTPSSVHGITCAPRSALLFVQGYNANIAKTFFQNMACLTNQATVERTVTQNYVTHAGQVIPVYMITPAQVVCRVRVYVDISITEEIVQNMKDAIMSLCRSVQAGQVVTSRMILDQLEAYKSYGLQGAMLSTDGENFDYKVTPLLDELLIFQSEAIDIIMPETLTA